MEQIEKIKEKLEESYLRLVIHRIPRPTKEAFLKWANAEFDGDYGMALKFLFDMHVGNLPNDVAYLVSETHRLSDEIEALKQKPEEKKVRRTVSGRVL